MRKPPEPLMVGPRFLVRWLNALLRYVVQTRQLESETIGLDERVDGVRAYLKNGEASAAAAVVEELRALQVFDASEGETPRVGLTVGRFGQNNQVDAAASMPLIDGIRIDAEETPYLTVSEDDKLAYLFVSVNEEGKVSQCAMFATTESDPPTPAEEDAQSEYYVSLAPLEVTVEDGVARVRVGTQNLSGSQSYELCGGEEHANRLI